jgi:hypothetical protein
MDKVAVYYTCLTHDPVIELACRKQLLKCNIPIVSVSRGKKIDFGDVRVVVEGEYGTITMFRQILAGCWQAKADFIFLCENDVLYHHSHFDFSPVRNDMFYYNTHVWKVRYPDGHAVWTDDLQQMSGICVYRKLALDYFTERVEQVERGEFNGHYEPSPRENWQSVVANLDIRHSKNLTRSKWSPEDFRNQKYAKGWRESDIIPGWGKFTEVINGLE